MNETIKKFGYPATLIAEFPHWVVLLRPAQVTLGRLVLAAKSEVATFGALPAEAFAGLQDVTRAIEAALSEAIAHDRINYLMLMMVDPHVHFHVIPRYASIRQWGGHDFPDTGWPKLPDLSQAVSLNNAGLGGLAEWLRQAFA